MGWDTTITSNEDKNTAETVPPREKVHNPYQYQNNNKKVNIPKTINTFKEAHPDRKLIVYY